MSEEREFEQTPAPTLTLDPFGSTMAATAQPQTKEEIQKRSSQQCSGRAEKL